MTGSSGQCGRERGDACGFGDGRVVHSQSHRRRVVIIVRDRGGLLLRAILRTVRHARDVHDDCFVGLNDRVLHRRHRRRTARAARGDHDLGPAARVVARQCGGSREAQVNRHVLTGSSGQCGRERGDSCGLGDVRVVDAQCHTRRVVIVGNGRGCLLSAGLRAVRHARDVDDHRLVRLIQRVLCCRDRDRAGGVAGRDDDLCPTACEVVCNRTRTREAQIDRDCLSGNRSQRSRNGRHARSFRDRRVVHAQRYRRRCRR